MDKGFIIINKNSGCTSHDVVNKLRRITGIRKIGHAGTLDPFASGVLVCAISRDATKRIREFVKMEKKYEGEIMLGAVTDTYDRTGRITHSVERGTWNNPPQALPDHPSQEGNLEVGALGLECGMHNAGCVAQSEQKLSFGYPKLSFVEEVLKEFIGKQKQLPPMFSAVKVGGRKLYELAREGKTSLRPPTDIEIFDIELLGYEWPKLSIKVKCSSGTYIRSLAHDIGEKLKCGAYLNELIRTRIGEFKISDAVTIEKLDKDNWREFLLDCGIVKY